MVRFGGKKKSRTSQESNPDGSQVQHDNTEYPISPNTQDSAVRFSESNQEEGNLVVDTNLDSPSQKQLSPNSMYSYQPPSFPHPMSNDSTINPGFDDRYATMRKNESKDMSLLSEKNADVGIATKDTGVTTNPSIPDTPKSNLERDGKYSTTLTKVLSEESYAKTAGDEESGTYYSMGVESFETNTRARSTFSYNTDDFYYVKQKIAFFSIFISVLQLGILSIMMALCGVAPFDVNPMIGPYPDTLSIWGGKNLYDLSTSQQWWKMFSPIALHTGVIHLFCNLAIQLETGAFFEREWGSVRWISIYTFSAFGSMLVNYICNPETVSVGSSGPIMGLFGAKLSEILSISLFETVRHERDFGDDVRLEQLGGILCSSLVVGLFALIPYVEWSGHMGGLMAGFLIGMIIFSRYINSWTFAILWGGAGFFGTVFLSVYGMKFLLSDVDVDKSLADPCTLYAGLHSDGYSCGCS